jgi:hypothetical protein
LPRVFAGNHVRFFQDTQRTQGDVFEISNRSRNEIEPWSKCGSFSLGSGRHAGSVLIKPVGIRDSHNERHELTTPQN